VVLLSSGGHLFSSRPWVGTYPLYAMMVPLAGVTHSPYRTMLSGTCCDGDLNLLVGYQANDVYLLSPLMGPFISRMLGAMAKQANPCQVLFHRKGWQDRESKIPTFGEQQVRSADSLRP